MPLLSDVVGIILRDITNAKIYADIASKDVFEAYKNDEILKNFSVPNLQIKDIKVNLKFAITNVNENNELEVAITENELTQIAPENISSLEFNSNITNQQIVNNSQIEN